MSSLEVGESLRVLVNAMRAEGETIDKALSKAAWQRQETLMQT